MSIEAMKQALAKFEHLWEIGIDAVYKVELLPEIQALRQAIEQAEKQEPVKCTCGYSIGHPLVPKCTCTPRKQWVGLTDDDLRQIILASIGVAEAKLKKKNT